MNELTRYVTVLGLCWFAAAIPALAEDGTNARQLAIERAREESIRRQELIIRAEKMVRDADQMAKEKKYEDAAAAYEQVLKFLPRSPATEKLYLAALRGATENRLRLANNALGQKDYTAARDNAHKILAFDTTNADANAVLAKADRLSARAEAIPDAGAVVDPTKNPEVIAKDQQVTKLLREGRLCFEADLIDEAEAKFKQAQSINPNNTDAMRYLKLVYVERQRLSALNRNTVVEQRLREVQDKWNPPIRRDVTLPLKRDEQTTMSLKDKIDTERKLNSIILPEVKFDGARIDSVVSFLVEESRRLDPDKKGVNIVLRLAEAPAGAAPAPGPFPPASTDVPGLPPIPGAEPLAPLPSAAPPPTAPASPGSAYPPITLNLRDIPLFDVLKLVTDLASLKFRIERRSVVIVPASTAPEGIISRVYPVQPGVFKNIVEIPEGGGGDGKLAALGSGVKKIEREDVKKFFVDAGVPFPGGTGISYNDRSSLLIVSNTPENLELFERVLAQLNFIPNQVEIEAKFIEITQQDVTELGFKWNIGSINFGGDKNQKYRAEGGDQTYPPNQPPNTASTGSDLITRGVRDVTSVLSANALDALLGSGGVLTPGATEIFSLSGVLTDPQFQVVIKMLSQKKNADLLSAPKITTVSGNTAQIKVVREFRYPTEFTPPTATAAGGSGTTGSGAVAITPPTPGGFETREVGVLLNVTPTVGPDGYTINLTLVPEVSDFDGFINYGSEGSIASGNQVVPVNFPVLQPVFSSRQVTTTIQIWDGQTVVLGGLIREDLVKINDKVPFLGDIPLIGRLFRSKADAKSKRNLLIFVTANLIDPAGNKIHKDDYGTPIPVPSTAPFEGKGG